MPFRLLYPVDNGLLIRTLEANIRCEIYRGSPSETREKAQEAYGMGLVAGFFPGHLGHDRTEEEERGSK